MKSKTILLLLISLTGFSLQANAAGSISGPGWYYQALPVGAIGNYTNIFLKGAFADEPACQVTRNNDFDPSNGIIPWNAGPGCHYIYQSDVGNANDLYSVAFVETGTILGLPADELQEYFELVEQINQDHDIKNYKVKMNRLIDSFSQPRR